ncbi:MAG: ABC transporter ATP-binding protein, partial [Candidatus Deferrimicrobiaceae bacterium]
FLPAELVTGADGVVTYPFEVTWTEYLGAERLVYGNVGEKSHALHVISRLPGSVSLPIETGRTYPFGVSRGNLRFFDRKSGLRTDRSPA